MLCEWAPCSAQLITDDHSRKLPTTSKTAFEGREHKAKLLFVVKTEGHTEK